MNDPYKQKDIETRTEKFLREYEDLCKKHQIQLVAYPQFVPTGVQGFAVGANISPLDRKYTSIPTKAEDFNESPLK
jgi:hypothetical protein